MIYALYITYTKIGIFLKKHKIKRTRHSNIFMWYSIMHTPGFENIPFWRSVLYRTEFKFLSMTLRDFKMGLHLPN